ncbi:MAG TPA: type II secretion system protein [Thiotrichales bacterium]|nr:type II secretion system protein [Thiotrichales bacterium]
MNKTFSTVKGFTLVEMAVALVVIGFLIAGGMNLMGASSDVSRYKKTQSLLEEAKEAVEGYYSINLKLPCPDTNFPPDGVSDLQANGVCVGARGFLPFVTLGVGGEGDAWGQPFKYMVQADTSRGAYIKPDSSASPATTEQNVANFFVTQANFCNPGRISETDAANISVKSLDVNQNNVLVDRLAFAILSTGKNGAQTNAGMTNAFSNDGGCSSLLAEPSQGVRLEQENCNVDSILRYGPQQSDGNSVLFDDMVVWVGDMQLMAALRTTGVCKQTATAFDPSKKTTTDFETGAVVHNEDFNGNDTVSTSNGNDKVVVKGDVKKTLDLKDGNNTLLVTGDVKSDGLIKGGSGNDIIRIRGELNKSVYLYGGNDQLEVEDDVDLNSSNDQIDMGDGDDQIRFYGDVKDANIKLGSGINTIYIKGRVDNVTITATNGSAVLYYDSDEAPRSRDLTLGSGVTIKCKINGAWVSCP